MPDVAQRPVEFAYRPPGLGQALAWTVTSLVAMAALCAAAAWLARRRAVES